MLVSVSSFLQPCRSFKPMHSPSTVPHSSFPPLHIAHFCNFQLAWFLWGCVFFYSSVVLAPLSFCDAFPLQPLDHPPERSCPFRQCETRVVSLCVSSLGVIITRHPACFSRPPCCPAVKTVFKHLFTMGPVSLLGQQLSPISDGGNPAVTHLLLSL